MFLGTPAAAVPSLRALVAGGFEVGLVVSQPDRRRGRGGAVGPSPVKAAALELGLPVTDRVDDVRDVGADLGVVVAFGEILRADLLEAVPMVNVHFSLLPRWRGAAPVERALLAGDEVTGVCVMDVVEELDAGGVHAREEVGIDDDVTAEELTADLAEVGAGLLIAALTGGLGEARPQEGEVTYAHKIRPADLLLDWARPAADLHRVVRVGGAWTTFRDGRFRVWGARVLPGDVVDGATPGSLLVVDGTPVVATGDGVLALDEVQPEGRARTAGPAWANGARLSGDEVLGR